MCASFVSTAMMPSGPAPEVLASSSLSAPFTKARSTETIAWLWMETDQMHWKFLGLFEDWVDGRVTLGTRQTRRQPSNVDLLGQVEQCTLSDWSPHFAELFSIVSAHLVDSVRALHWAYIIRNVTDYPGCPNPSSAQIRRADSINISTAILLRRNDVHGLQGWDRMGWDGMLQV